MAVLLFIIGAVGAMGGVAMVAYGIPINEFSFGNTLIAAGVSAFMGGLIIFGLGAVVRQLHRLVEALGARPPLRAGRPSDLFEAPAPASRIPFPPKSKAALRPDTAPVSVEPETVPEGLAAADAAPTLPNPDESPAAAEAPDELPSRQSFTLPAKMETKPEGAPHSASATNGLGGSESHSESAAPAWRASKAPVWPTHGTTFDAMWPSTKTKPMPSEPGYQSKPESKSEEKVEARPEAKAGSKFESRFGSKSDLKYDARPDTPSQGIAAEPSAAEPAPDPAAAPAAAKPAGDSPRAVAILKSGVVDGMGYTLYVDGSIEAELSQGTLRFASINELRSHLEKTS
jgi:hypothetical protein